MEQINDVSWNGGEADYDDEFVVHGREQEPEKTSPVVPVNLAKKPIKEIRDTLAVLMSARHVKTKRKGGAELVFLDWFTVYDYMDFATNGHWSSFVKSVQFTASKCVITSRVEVYASDGTYVHEDVGYELLKKLDDRTGEEKDISYGDPFSNAKQMSVKRACAGFGTARILYHKGDWREELRERKARQKQQNGG